MGIYSVNFEIDKFLKYTNAACSHGQKECYQSKGYLVCRSWEKFNENVLGLTNRWMNRGKVWYVILFLRTT